MLIQPLYQILFPYLPTDIGKNDVFIILFFNDFWFYSFKPCSYWFGLDFFLFFIIFVIRIILVRVITFKLIILFIFF